MAFALKRTYIWLIGIVVCIALLLTTGMIGELLEAIVVVALAFFAYTVVGMAADRYGVA
jgi:hypothetical protein